MEDLKSRVAYLKGLAAGLNFDASSREGKLFEKVIEVIDSLAEAVTELQDDFGDLVDYTEALDEDLSELEEDFYEEEEEEDDDDDDDDDDEDDDDDDEELFSVECPDCHEIVYIDDDMLEDDDVVEILCPNCERVVFVNDDEDFEEFEDDLVQTEDEER